MDQKVTLALIGIIPACLTAAVGYLGGIKSAQDNYDADSKTETHAKAELKTREIQLKQDPNPSLRSLVYPNYGISLLAPVSWTTEDGPARLAGGEFNLVHRYEATKGAIGINFRLRPVQPNYIDNISEQIKNQLDTYRATDKNAEVEDTTISGISGKVFKYTVVTGSRKMEIRQYWVRLVPTVQLQITAAQYSDASDTKEFWEKTSDVMKSIVIATNTWQQRYSEESKN